MAPVTRSLRITGRVQGVAFRAWARSQARNLGLEGWVKNRDDGSVLALVSGPKEKVEKMITACWSGPGAARVQNVNVEDAEPPENTGFHILR